MPRSLGGYASNHRYFSRRALSMMRCQWPISENRVTFERGFAD